ncbi:hypothetical protein CC80DRAFT_498816 [Byssothecium circinans]|uniref:Uncharacterized protein n=1 Tax=Byssothecium circinans TaxID=147558 RepID=A0A6A5UEP0_9PLEO|nr:hypothetical protein CC80DRAFT_498816 [Byssothecium circinans]
MAYFFVISDSSLDQSFFTSSPIISGTIIWTSTSLCYLYVIVTTLGTIYAICDAKLNLSFYINYIEQSKKSAVDWQRLDERAQLDTARKDCANYADEIQTLRKERDASAQEKRAMDKEKQRLEKTVAHLKAEVADHESDAPYQRLQKTYESLVLRNRRAVKDRGDALIALENANVQIRLRNINDADFQASKITHDHYKRNWELSVKEAEELRARVEQLEAQIKQQQQDSVDSTELHDRMAQLESENKQQAATIAKLTDENKQQADRIVAQTEKAEKQSAEFQQQVKSQPASQSPQASSGPNMPSTPASNQAQHNAFLTTSTTPTTTPPTAGAGQLIKRAMSPTPDEDAMEMEDATTGPQQQSPPAFGQPSAPAFGSSGLNQPSAAPAFGVSGFGTVGQPSPSSPFGQQPSPAFGQSGFGAPNKSSALSAFASSSQLKHNSPSFQQSKPAGSFGTSNNSSPPSAFFQQSKPAGCFGVSASPASGIGSFQQKTSVQSFGQPAFGQPSIPASSNSSPLGRKPAFGQPSIPASSSSSPFGNKPAFGQPSIPASSSSSPFGSKPAFGQPSTPLSSFSSNGFNQSKAHNSLAFGQPAFGGSQHQQNNTGGNTSTGLSSNPLFASFL